MKLKILLVEDNQSDVELIRYELKKSDLEFVLTVVQTRGAFEKALEQLQPDVILSDYSLPAFDGLAAFRTKQELYPEIPFIIVSGIIGDENAVELIKLGVTDYTLKDKLFMLVPKIERGLKEAEEIRGKRIAHDQLKMQNKNLTEIAFLQSHQVRAPIARILGLFNLFNFHDLADKVNGEVLRNLKTVAESFDELIHEIVNKTNQIKPDGVETSRDAEARLTGQLIRRSAKQLKPTE